MRPGGTRKLQLHRTSLHRNSRKSVHHITRIPGCLSHKRFADQGGRSTNFSVADKPLRNWCSLQSQFCFVPEGAKIALSGDKTRANAAYKDFLTLWKDAAPDIPILQEAKAEYARLQ